MKSRFLLIALFTLLLPALVLAASDSRRIKASSPARPVGEKRIALVIGNSAYKDAPLKNPVNDANAMAQSLKGAGFEVILKTNANRKEMNALVRDFGDRLQRGGMGLFYFAGHGMQVAGKNYLIPIGAEIHREDEVPDESLPADLVLRKMETANNGLNLVVLDACRNNPFARSFRSAGSGLGRMDAPSGTLMVYATRPGSVAADGDGANGVFTKHFLTKMKQPGLDLANLVGEVSDAVEKETRKAQQPWIEGNLKGSRFYFYGPATVPQAPAGDDTAERRIQEAEERARQAEERARQIEQQAAERSRIQVAMAPRPQSEATAPAAKEEVYTDPQTGLIWPRNGNIAGKTMNWHEAVAWVKTLNHGGYSDWRLPTIEELEVFVKPGGARLSEWFNANGFSNVNKNFYWSSSLLAGYADGAWSVNMNGGYLVRNHKAYRYYVWPVRAGQ